MPFHRYERSPLLYSSFVLAISVLLSMFLCASDAARDIASLIFYGELNVYMERITSRNPDTWMSNILFYVITFGMTAIYAIAVSISGNVALGTVSENRYAKPQQNVKASRYMLFISSLLPLVTIIYITMSIFTLPSVIISFFLTILFLVIWFFSFHPLPPLYCRSTPPSTVAPRTSRLRPLLGCLEPLARASHRLIGLPESDITIKSTFSIFLLAFLLAIYVYIYSYVFIYISPIDRSFLFTIFGPYPIVFGFATTAVIVWTIASLAWYHCSPKRRAWLIVFIMAGMCLTALRPGPARHPIALHDSTDTPSTIEEHFSQWIAKRREEETDRIPVIFVAAAGGGARAAYHSGQVLGAIQDKWPNFNKHIFAMSGVSGGSLGVAQFAITTNFGIPAPGEICQGSFKCQARASLKADFLSAVLGEALFVDFPLQVIGWPADRSKSLEYAFDFSGALHLYGGNNLRDLIKNNTNIPSLFFNTTREDTGTPVVISNLRFDPALSDRSKVDAAPERVTLWDLVQKKDVQLNTAIGLSARFPIITPGGVLKDGDLPGGVLVDGGYHDNTGLDTIRAVIEQAMPEQFPPDIEPILVYIDSAPDVAEGKNAGIKSLAEASVLLAPLTALDNVRTARAQELIKNIKKWADTKGIRFVHYRLQNGDVPIPLNWVMSGITRSEIDKRVEADMNPEKDDCGPWPPLCDKLVH